MLYTNNGVYAVPEHNVHSGLCIVNGEKPAWKYEVWAGSQAGAIRAALVAANDAAVKANNVGDYKLTLGSDADLALNRMAQEQGCTVADVLVKAINTYATVKRRADDGRVWVKERVDGELKVRSIAIP